MNLRQTEEWQLNQKARPPQDRDPVLGCHDRRSFLRAVGSAGLAASSVLRSGAVLLGSGAALLQSGRADAREREPLIQPSEIRSENGILRTTITAAPARVQLGDFAFPGFVYNGALFAAAAQATPWRHHADHVQEQPSR